MRFVNKKNIYIYFFRFKRTLQTLSEEDIEYMVLRDINYYLDIFAGQCVRLCLYWINLYGLSEDQFFVYSTRIILIFTVLKIRDLIFTGKKLNAPFKKNKLAPT